MYTVAVTMVNGHSVHIPCKDGQEKFDLVQSLTTFPIVTVFPRGMEETHIVTKYISVITVYKEDKSK